MEMKTKYNKELSQKIWDGLTKSQQMECLRQAEKGECNAPAGLSIEVWKCATHYMKHEGLAWVAHIEGGECEAIRLLDIGKAYLGLIQPTARAQKEKRDTAAAKILESQALQGVKQELVKAGLIVDGQWQGTPAEFGCLVLALFEQHKVATNGGKAWTACKDWAGYKDNIKSARNAIDANPNTRGDRAETIRRICEKK